MGFNIRRLRKQYSMYEMSWSNRIKQRDGYRCQQCDDTPEAKIDLQAHHLFYRHHYPKLKELLNNGITLCGKCHKELHELNG